MSDLSPQDKYLFRQGLDVLSRLINKDYGLLRRSDFLEKAGQTQHTMQLWMILFGVDEVEYTPGDLFGGADPANDSVFDLALSCSTNFPLFQSLRDDFIQGIQNELPF